ncbi:hypothetical protein KIPB_001564, partial [Kipferlia bialata]
WLVKTIRQRDNTSVLPVIPIQSFSLCPDMDLSPGNREPDRDTGRGGEWGEGIPLAERGRGEVVAKQLLRDKDDGIWCYEHAIESAISPAHQIWGILGLSEVASASELGQACNQFLGTHAQLCKQNKGLDEIPHHMLSFGVASSKHHSATGIVDQDGLMSTVTQFLTGVVEGIRTIVHEIGNRDLSELSLKRSALCLSDIVTPKRVERQPASSIATMASDLLSNVRSTVPESMQRSGMGEEGAVPFTRLRDVMPVRLQKLLADYHLMLGDTHQANIHLQTAQRTQVPGLDPVWEASLLVSKATSLYLSNGRVGGRKGQETRVSNDVLIAWIGDAATQFSALRLHYHAAKCRLLQCLLHLNLQSVPSTPKDADMQLKRLPPEEVSAAFDALHRSCEAMLHMHPGPCGLGMLLLGGRVADMFGYTRRAALYTTMAYRTVTDKIARDVVARYGQGDLLRGLACLGHRLHGVGQHALQVARTQDSLSRGHQRTGTGISAAGDASEEKGKRRPRPSWSVLDGMVSDLYGSLLADRFPSLRFLLLNGLLGTSSNPSPSAPLSPSLSSSSAAVPQVLRTQKGSSLLNQCTGLVPSLQMPESVTPRVPFVLHAAAVPPTPPLRAIPQSSGSVLLVHATDGTERDERVLFSSVDTCRIGVTVGPFLADQPITITGIVCRRLRAEEEEPREGDLRDYGTDIVKVWPTTLSPPLPTPHKRIVVIPPLVKHRHDYTVTALIGGMLQGPVSMPLPSPRPVISIVPPTSILRLSAAAYSDPLLASSLDRGLNGPSDEFKTDVFSRYSVENIGRAIPEPSDAQIPVVPNGTRLIAYHFNTHTASMHAASAPGSGNRVSRRVRIRGIGSMSSTAAFPPEWNKEIVRQSSASDGALARLIPYAVAVFGEGHRETERDSEVVQVVDGGERGMSLLSAKDGLEEEMLREHGMDPESGEIVLYLAVTGGTERTEFEFHFVYAEGVEGPDGEVVEYERSIPVRLTAYPMPGPTVTGCTVSLSAQFLTCVLSVSNTIAEGDTSSSITIFPSALPLPDKVRWASPLPLHLPSRRSTARAVLTIETEAISDLAVTGDAYRTHSRTLSQPTPLSLAEGDREGLVGKVTQHVLDRLSSLLSLSWAPTPSGPVDVTHLRDRWDLPIPVETLSLHPPDCLLTRLPRPVSISLVCQEGASVGEDIEVHVDIQTCVKGGSEWVGLLLGYPIHVQLSLEAEAASPFGVVSHSLTLKKHTHSLGGLGHARRVSFSLAGPTAPGPQVVKVVSRVATQSIAYTEEESVTVDYTPMVGEGAASPGAVSLSLSGSLHRGMSSTGRRARDGDGGLGVYSGTVPSGVAEGTDTDTDGSDSDSEAGSDTSVLVSSE